MKTRALLLLLVTLAFAGMPLIIPPFMGYDPGTFPVRIERPSIQPAGYAFSIWLLIYVWLIAHAGFGLLKRAQDPVWDATRLPLILSIALGTVWLFIAKAMPMGATLAIWLMLALALYAYLRTPTPPDRWWLGAPMALYAGWLTAAASVSLGIMLAGYGLLSDTASALAMLVLVLIIGICVQSQRPGMPVYALTLIWALIGVALVNRSANPTVAYAAMAGILALIGALAATRRIAAH
jgi:hypothetical protein